MLRWDQLGGMEEKQEWDHSSEVDNYYISSAALWNFSESEGSCRK